MKIIKSILLVCCACAAVTFTSCVGNDGPTVLTKEQKAAAFQQIKGNYTGKLVYKNPTSTTASKLDSVDVKWEMLTDSTMRINNFPTAPLVKNITNKEISAALATLPPQALNCMIDIRKNDPLLFTVNPKPLEYNTTYEGKAHHLKILFFINTNGSFGGYIPAKKRIQIQIVIASVFVDGKPKPELIKGYIPVVLDGKREK